MAEHSLTLSHVRIQSQPHALAEVRAWALKAICGHSRPFFGSGPASLPAGHCAPSCLPLTGKEVRHG